MQRRSMSEFDGFETEAAAVLQQAFTEACIALRVFAGDRRGREAVAARIVDLARTGVRDPVALRDCVVLEATVRPGGGEEDRRRQRTRTRDLVDAR